MEAASALKAFFRLDLVNSGVVSSKLVLCGVLSHAGATFSSKFAGAKVRVFTSKDHFSNSKCRFHILHITV